MTRSDIDDSRARAAIDRVASLLDAETLSARTTEPIDRAVRRYRCPTSTVRSQDELLEQLGRFLHHLFADAFPNGRQHSLTEARAEAIDLLETSGFPGGYPGAYLAAIDPASDGLQDILAVLTDTVRARAQQLYVHWVLSSQVDPLDWDLKCQIAELLLDRVRAHLPDELLQYPPEHFADCPALLFKIALAVGALRESSPEKQPIR